VNQETFEQDPVELLGSVPLFAELDGKDLRKLAGLCLRKVFPGGAVIVEEGATGLGLYVVTTGSVEIFKGRGPERLDLAVLEQGDILGEMSLIDDAPRSATAVAREETACLLITRDSFQTLVKKNPGIAWCIVPILAGRLRKLEERLVTAWTIPSEKAPEREETAGAVRAEETEPEEDGWKPADGQEGVTEVRGRDLLRVEYAAFMAGLEGLRRSVDVCETFLDTLARETGVLGHDAVKQSVEAFPAAFRKALSGALRDGERIPERMLSTFRRQRRRD